MMGAYRIPKQGFMELVLRPAWTGRHAGLPGWLFFVLFYAILANIPFWMASNSFGLVHHGVFCLEYAAVGLLALFVPRIFSAGLLLSVVATDMVCGACRTYYLSVTECLTNISIFHALSGPRRHAAVAVVLLTLLVTAIAAYLPAPSVQERHRRRAAACLIAFAIALASADCLTIVRKTGHFPNPLQSGQSGDQMQLSLANSVRLARVPIVRLIPSELEAARVRKMEISNEGSTLSVPSGAAVGIRFAGLSTSSDRQEMPNLVIVLVESWGLAASASLNDALVRPYAQSGLRARYEVIQGTVPFSGSTVPGEARELCGNSFGFHIVNASAAELRGCLPQRLAALGYRTMALHGMDGHFFARSTWYGRAGFEERWFNDRFKGSGLPDCPGAFTGTCDAAIAEWLGHRLSEHNADPYFVHWVTLNSHLPMLVPSPLADGAPCLTSIGLAPQSPLCSWYQLVANVHRSVSRLATAELGRSTIFVIVGDHAPPFADPALRGQFSSTVVPYVVLAPRVESRQANWLEAHNASGQATAAGKTLAATP
jgi:hypothetical protein